MKSLRIRLITWYVSVGAIIVVCIGLLGAVGTVEAASFQARQAMAEAARQAPGLIAQYRAAHHGLDGVDDFMHERFAARGVIAHVISPKNMVFNTRMIKGAGFPLPPPPPKDGIGFITTQQGPIGVQQGPISVQPGPMVRIEHARPPLFVSMLAMAIKPVTASFPGGDVILFVDPRSFKGLFDVLGIFVLVIAAIILPAAWRIAVAVAGNTLEPLLRTTKALNRFGIGDFTPEAVNTKDRSELGELARAYNRAVAQVTRAFDERSKTEGEMRQFVADAGHQLRTPLTVIMGYLSGMAHRAESPQQAQVYNAMLSQARRMKCLIDDLITLARLEHPSAVGTEYLDLNGLCARLSSNFDPAAQERIHVRTAPTAAFIYANETDISGALCALVDNALKYAPGSDVELTIVQDNANWVVSVADRGPGMTGDDLRGAFDRFYRGSAADSVEGTGLGLPIVRKSVERMGGTILLCNRSSGGLLATIRLPKAQVTAAAAQ
jgi:signal transduction histidine kinase